MKKNNYKILLSLVSVFMVGCTINSSFVPPPSSQSLEPVSQKSTTDIKKVTLLLPLSGHFASSGRIIRDGFLSAYYEALRHGANNLTINFLDTNVGGIKNLYNRAISDGAEFIIGPLTKADVEAIVGMKTLPAPTLVLNTIDQYTANKIINLYQFGLSSRDEAGQIAKKAWDSNLRQAMIVVPKGARGQNLAATLTSVWRYFGGSVKDAVIYDNIMSANQNIRTALNINTNIGRGHTKFEPYGGNDVDVVFLVASPEQGREVQPLLRFYLNPNIPVYAISDIYSGVLHASSDMDLEGVVFCDMPWILQADKLPEPLSSLQKNFYGRSHGRLYALGVDAYYLMLNLQTLVSNSKAALNGATGLLSIDKYQHVHRTLNFAKIHNGVPIAIDN